jgi:hypothetical protein
MHYIYKKKIDYKKKTPDFPSLLVLRPKGNYSCMNTMSEGKDRGRGEDK